MNERAAESAGARSPRPWRLALQLAGLSAFACAQPLFDILGRNGEFFVAHRATAGDIVLLSALLALGPALLWIGLAWALGRLGGGFAGGAAPVVSLLVTLIALPVLLRLEAWLPVVSFPLACLLGLLAGWLYRRRAGVRTFCLALSPAVVLFPLGFLFATPVATLLRAPAETTGTVAVERIAGTTPVVMVVFDELALASLLDAEGEIRHRLFPHFAALAQTSHWFRNATTVALTTTESVPALLSGRLPRESALPTAADHPQNLFALLQAGGYGLRAFEWQTSLCAGSDCTEGRPAGTLASRLAAMASDLAIVYGHIVLPDGLAGGLPAVDASWRDFSRPAQAPASGEQNPSPVAFFDRFLEALRTGRRSTLYFVHVGLPHVPWRYLPSGREYGPINMPIVPHGAYERAWADDPWLVSQAYQRYLLQVGLVDRLIGRVRASLEAAGMWDESLIVVVADHGIAFVPGEPRRSLLRESVDEVLNIPLFVKLPGQRTGAVSERHVETIDLLPSLADVLGVRLPWQVDGTSVFEVGGAGSIALARGDKPSAKQFGYSAEALIADRRRTGELMASLLGDPMAWDDLLAIGPAVERVLGLPVARLTAGAGGSPQGVEVVLDQPEQWQAVDPQGSYVPVHVSGRVVGSLGAPRQALAVALNGVVRATTWSYLSPAGEVRFRALVPESSLVSGPNQVEILWLDLEGPAPRATQLRRRGALAYRLVTGDAGSALESSDGVRLPIEAPVNRGRARIHSAQLGPRVRGNLKPRDPEVLPDLLVATLDGEPLFAAPFASVRRPSPPQHKGQLVHFELRLPEHVARHASGLRLYLIVAGRPEPITIK